MLLTDELVSDADGIMPELHKNFGLVTNGSYDDKRVTRSTVGYVGSAHACGPNRKTPHIPRVSPRC
jgi:hypothetical protein